jgi:hypothetical protein
MKVIVVQMSLAQRDLYITQIEAQIEAKRKLLLEKQKKMNVLAKQNSFLVGVRDDYNRYHQYIVNEKQEQIRAMEVLQKYLSELANSTNMTVNNIKDAKIEQDKILREMRKIKGELDTIK